MQMIFLAGFLFRRPKPSNPYRTQITEEEHPLFFQFIHHLVKETKISFPKKIFLVPDVNTTICCDAGFLSLFRPVGKNLEIGLGLVNSLNISELRMVMAHEFAHFSQHNMKRVSYAYSLNKLIYKMLYENEGWSSVAIRWSNRGILFAIFARIAAYIANGVQQLLRKLYALINRQYRQVSREMEFRADTIALSLTGTQSAISALRRTELGSFCFEHCLQELPELAAQQRRIGNIYELHNALIRYYAIRNQLPLDHRGLPVITDTYFESFVKSRVQFREQWTSHPSREEREQRYLAAAVTLPQVTDSAWMLFNAPEELQQNISDLIYLLELPESITDELYPPEDFIAEITHRRRRYDLPAVFNEYYDNRPFPVFPTTEISPLAAAEMTRHSLLTLYTKENVQRIRYYFRNRQDLETLQAVANGEIQTRYFEFDGQQYPGHSAVELIPVLQTIIQEQSEWLTRQDSLALRFHYTHALQRGAAAAAHLEEQYNSLLQHQHTADLLRELVAEILQSISVLYGTGAITIKNALPYFDILRQESSLLKDLLPELIAQPALTAGWEPALLQRAEHFLTHDYSYLLENELVTDEIQTLQHISSAILEHYNDSILLMKKAFLERVLEEDSLPWTLI